MPKSIGNKNKKQTQKMLRLQAKNENNILCILGEKNENATLQQTVSH